MAADRVIAMKHAQAAEDNANAMKQMVEKVSASEAQIAALITMVNSLTDKLDKLITSHDDSANAVYDLMNAAVRRGEIPETITTKPEITKKGK